MVLSSMFARDQLVPNLRKLRGSCVKGTACMKYKKYRRPVDRQARLRSKHFVNKKLKEAHTRYIEEILGIAKFVDPKVRMKTLKLTLILTRTTLSQKMYSLF